MNRIAATIATVFGIGLLPISGTAASAAALPFGWLLAYLTGWQGLLIAAVTATVLGIWACGTHAKAIGIEDPSECVMDEVAGQWFALLPMGIWLDAFGWRALLGSFVLFRFFDILKPWPIYKMERWHGGIGIMADDVAAGLISAVLLLIAMKMGWL